MFLNTSKRRLPWERELDDFRLTSIQIYLGAHLSRLAANVAQSDMPYAGTRWDSRHAGDFCQGAPTRFIFAQGGRALFKLEPGKLAMHLAARADAFHVLLADVTALGEIESLGLSLLLWEIAIPYVLAILRNAVEYPPPLQSLNPDVLRAWEASGEHATLAFVFGHGHPYFVPARL